MSERDSLVARARQLRSDEGLSTSEIAARLAVPRSTVRGWFAGMPPAAGSWRPGAKDRARQRAIGLRATGWAVPEIAQELGVARSTAWLWVRHLPLDVDSPRSQARRNAARANADSRWRTHRVEREAHRLAVLADSISKVGKLSDRDLIMIGAALYWCEGAKSKPWREWVTVTFVNSDPDLVRLFLAFLRRTEVDDELIDYRVHIHESADLSAAVRWWAGQIGVPADKFRRTTVKKHRPTTNRRNRGADYHGCLAVSVRRSRPLYWQIEGIMRGLAASVGHAREDAP